MSAREFVRKHWVALLIAIPFFIYGSVKVPSSHSCVFRPAGQVEEVDGTVGFFFHGGPNDSTNILVAACGQSVTNEYHFDRGCFYFEQSLFPASSKVDHRFWVRKSSTNDWIMAEIDIWADENVGAEWLSGWMGCIAHIDNYEDPRNYQQWFFGPRENLPEKVVEGGIGIKITRYVRTSRFVLVEFERTDEKLVGKPVSIIGRLTSIVDGARVLGDWQVLDTTLGDMLKIDGNFVQYYNELRLRAEKEHEQ